jgi:hypothetical protein
LLRICEKGTISLNGIACQPCGFKGSENLPGQKRRIVLQLYSTGKLIPRIQDKALVVIFFCLYKE